MNATASQTARTAPVQGYRLGRTQKLVLHLLANHDRPPTIRDLAFDWPGLSESSVRGAIDRLGERRLVDVAGFDGNARTYTLTGRGASVERDLVGADEGEWIA